jgi:hypothetical protein
MDPRLGRQTAPRRSKVDDGDRRRLGSATPQPPELSRHLQHHSLAEHILENGRARNHARQDPIGPTTKAQASRQQQSADERDLAERQLPQCSVGTRGVGIHLNLVPRREFVSRQELVEVLHATSQTLCATRA